jgi:DNA-binding MarR family transcriptional regulator
VAVVASEDTELAHATDRAGDRSPFALGLMLRRAHARAAGAMSAAVRPFGLELRHFSVLIILVDRGPTTQRDLVTETGWDKAGIMRVVDDLETRGLVVRKPVPGDRRVRLVEITTRGRKVFEGAHAEAPRLAEQLVSHLAPGEAEQLLDLVTRFAYPPETGA